MAKAFAIFGMAVAIIFFLVFTMDLATGLPFSKASVVADVGFMVSALALGYISWTTFRELK
ncbi:MAG: hypothetical protein SGJ20_11395 [Planctomycetota bacterium]|nr:hypothetical protein [Planctomycetota bacterium]